jgi:hypothetical protein
MSKVWCSQWCPRQVHQHLHSSALIILEGLSLKNIKRSTVAYTCPQRSFLCHSDPRGTLFQQIFDIFVNLCCILPQDTYTLRIHTISLVQIIIFVNLPLFLTPERASWVGAAGGFAILMRVMARAGIPRGRLPRISWWQSCKQWYE